MLSGDARNALAVVNIARTAFGLSALAELPRAREGQSGDCVLARAFHGIDPNVSVADRIVFSDTERGRRAAALIGTMTGAGVAGSSVECPPSLKRLWQAFDAGRTPEYGAHDGDPYRRGVSF